MRPRLGGRATCVADEHARRHPAGIGRITVVVRRHTDHCRGGLRSCRGTSGTRSSSPPGRGTRVPAGQVNRRHGTADRRTADVGSPAAPNYFVSRSRRRKPSMPSAMSTAAMAVRMSSGRCRILTRASEVRGRTVRDSASRAGPAGCCRGRSRRCCRPRRSRSGAGRGGASRTARPRRR